MASSRRKPRHREQVSPLKRPRGEVGSTDSYTIAWQIGIVDSGGTWGWSNIQPQRLWGNIVKKMGNFETMTWAQIMEHKHTSTIEVREICREAQKRLEKIGQDDVDELVHLGPSGLERIWGIRDGRVFKLIWWDPNHTVCPSTKGHS